MLILLVCKIKASIGGIRFYLVRSYMVVEMNRLIFQMNSFGSLKIELALILYLRLINYSVRFEIASNKKAHCCLRYFLIDSS